MNGLLPSRKCSTGILLKAKSRSYPIPSADQKASEKLVNWSAHDPWVLNLKLGSPWTSVKWISLKNVIPERFQDSEARWRRFNKGTVKTDPCVVTWNQLFGRDSVQSPPENSRHRMT